MRVCLRFMVVVLESLVRRARLAVVFIGTNLPNCSALLISFLEIIRSKAGCYIRGQVEEFLSKRIFSNRQFNCHYTKSIYSWFF